MGRQIKKKGSIKNCYKIIFTGGGSGGHTMPAIAVISEIKKISELSNKKFEILYIGSHNGVEKSIIENSAIPYKSINTGKLRRYFSIKNFFDIFNILTGFIQSALIIKKYRPELIVSTGGFVSIPPVLSGKLFNIPIIIHEQTINAGLANIIASKFSDIAALTFPESKKYFNNKKTVLTGLPMRKELFSADKESAYKKLGLDKKLPTIYFTGGGLGCHLLNITVLTVLEDLLKNYNIIFQTGKNKDFNDYADYIRIKKGFPQKLKKRLIIFDFIKDELKDIYALTDIAVSRSGAGTVCELAAAKIPAIYIPLAIATKNEQYKNARSIEEKGGAVIIEEKDLNPEILMKTIKNLSDKKKIQIMRKNLSKAKVINGTDIFIKLILNMLENKRDTDE